jgi:hypothetical protein
LIKNRKKGEKKKIPLPLLHQEEKPTPKITQIPEIRVSPSHAVVNLTARLLAHLAFLLAEEMR